MKMPEHYEKWLSENEASEPGGFDPLFKEGAVAMFDKLMEDIKPAIEALKFYGDEDNWQEPDKFVMYWTLWDDGDNVGHQKAAEVIAKFKKKGLVE